MKAVIRVGEAEIELVGGAGEVAEVIRQFAGGTLRPALEVTTTTRNDDDQGTGGQVDHVPSDDAGEEKSTDRSLSRLPDARHFFKQHPPTNNREATAVAAFYLREVAPAEDRSASMTKEQLLSVFREANYRLPKRPDQTLVDTEAAGYLKRIERGRYEITNVGHNLVVHTLGSTDADA